MSLTDALGSLVSLVAAAGLSGIVGLERQFQQKAAGFRTHMLVGVGSALFTILSIHAFPAPSESSRVAAQIVTGIGFLGAGAIFKEGVNVRGLTTAAGLWTVAAVGMAAGAGQLLGATAATVVVVGILFGLRHIDAALYRRLGGPVAAVAVVLADAGVFADVWATVAGLDRDLRDFAFEADGDGGGTMTLHLDATKAAGIVEILATRPGVIDAYLIDPA